MGNINYMKKIIFGILAAIGLSLSALLAQAAYVTAAPACNSVTFNYPNYDQANSGYFGAKPYGISKIFKDELVIKDSGQYDSLMRFFTDYGANNEYFLNGLIPNNTYSYDVASVINADSGISCVGLSASSCRQLKTQKTVTDHFSMQTYCPPSVSVVSNALNAPAVTPNIDTSNDTNLIELKALSSTWSSITLGVDVSKLNLGHYQSKSATNEGALPKGGLYVVWKKSYWGTAYLKSSSFFCSISQCDIGLNDIPIPPDPKADTARSAYYTHSYSYDVYKVSQSGEIIIPTDAVYDILRNGQEIGKRIPASQKTFIDSGLIEGASYSYTVRAPSIYAREGITNIPNGYVGSYGPGIYTFEYGKSPFVISPILLPASQTKSFITKTSGTYSQKATVVLDINIPYDSAGEYRTPGVIDVWQGSGPWTGCVSINHVPSNCIYNWTPEKITTVSSDKTYDILRASSPAIEVAGRVSINQRNFIDTNLTPGTTYTYTVRVPSIHSREGLQNGVGVPGAEILPPLPTSPAETVLQVTTPGIISPPPVGGAGAGGGAGGGGGVLPPPVKLQPGNIKEIRP
jgi:hypothetical protein